MGGPLVQGRTGATPCFEALVRPKPSRLCLGSLPPTLRQNDLAADIDNDTADDIDADTGVVSERDTPVGADDFNPAIAFQ